MNISQSFSHSHLSWVNTSYRMLDGQIVPSPKRRWIVTQSYFRINWTSPIPTLEQLSVSEHHALQDEQGGDHLREWQRRHHLLLGHPAHGRGRRLLNTLWKGSKRTSSLAWFVNNERRWIIGRPTELSSKLKLTKTRIEI